MDALKTLVGGLLYLLYAPFAFIYAILYSVSYIIEYICEAIKDIIDYLQK